MNKQTKANSDIKGSEENNRVIQNLGSGDDRKMVTRGGLAEIILDG